jgi:hypothetical protein
VILVSTPVTYAPPDPVIQNFGSLTHRTIKVDGNPVDWVGIPPLVSDNIDEPGVTESEDIKAVYGANDDDNLYFLMELDGLSFSADSTSTTQYIFYLDILPGGDPNNGNADYAIKYDNGVTTLCKYSFWGQVDCPGVKGAMDGTTIEVSLPWACIGGEQCFNCLFKADEIGTDWAPDNEPGFILLGCCPGEPKPIGGNILPPSILVTTIIPVIVAISTIVLLTTRKKIH